jgi:ubiquinone/menaquinone biosynthesis C-methylase UbiE
MSTPPVLPMPDFDRMAATFDRFLPQIHPVTLALLERLPELAAGATVLDVACGTGEPGLTLARRSPALRLLGVDRAEAMIAVAQGKAERESLANARFAVMSSESLDIPDGSMDCVLSRFGVMMFGDVPASARELARVLRPGGPFSLAVWEDMAKNTLVNAMTTVLRDHLPANRESPMRTLNEWAAEGLRTRLLEEAGLGVVRSEMFGWSYRFERFADAWDLVSGMGAFTGQSTLSEEAQQQVKVALEAALSAYRQPSGEHVIPHACRLIWGQR